MDKWVNIDWMPVMLILEIFILGFWVFASGFFWWIAFRASGF